MVTSGEEPSLYVLGELAKLRKATISFVMIVCPSVRLEQLVSHWTDIMKFYI